MSAPPLFERSTKEREFIPERVVARRGIIDFALELEPEFFDFMFEDPEGSLNELNILHILHTGDPLVTMQSYDEPPEEFTSWLSDDLAMVEGFGRLEDGLWFRIKNGWNKMRYTESASLSKHRRHAAIPTDLLLPENFLQHAVEVKMNKRPVVSFTLMSEGEEMEVFAKGSAEYKSFYYQEGQPQHRLTCLANLSKTSANEEMQRFKLLASAGVATPEIVALYTSSVEEWLIVKKIEGEEIPAWLTSEEARRLIIQQDATMLATLCRLGFRKQGFNAFDDKLFDGHDLYLIDAEDLTDLYMHRGIDYRAVIVDPTDEEALKNFRNYQREVFLSQVKDAIFGYKDDLLDTRLAAQQYLYEFAKALGLNLTQEEYEEVLNTSKDHMSEERWISIMSDV